jgi:hypothetical protein
MLVALSQCNCKYSAAHLVLKAILCLPLHVLTGFLSAGCNEYRELRKECGFCGIFLPSREARMGEGSEVLFVASQCGCYSDEFLIK